MKKINIEPNTLQLRIWIEKKRKQRKKIDYFTMFADGLLEQCNLPWICPWPCPDMIPSAWQIFGGMCGNSIGVVISCGWAWLKCQLICSIWWMTFECSWHKSWPMCSISMSSFFLSLLYFAFRASSISSNSFNSFFNTLYFVLISYRSFNWAFISFSNFISAVTSEKRIEC